MTQHTENSSYREKLVEHLFVAELLKFAWLHHDCSLEVAKPEVDNSGYDLIVEAKGVVRHIQLKTSIVGGKTAVQKIHTKLAEKASGCVVWIYVDEGTLSLGPFLYFGAEAGKPLPSLADRKVAKHTKGNKDGVKAQRPNVRVIPKGIFTPIESIENLYGRLFSKEYSATGALHIPKMTSPDINKRRDTFTFEGGEQLTSIGAAFFVSYSYYLHVDPTHRPWESIKTKTTRVSTINSCSQYHLAWLECVGQMSDTKLSKNTLGLDGGKVKAMARAILEVRQPPNARSSLDNTAYEPN